jgi:hypothetical protein
VKASPDSGQADPHARRSWSCWVFDELDTWLWQGPIGPGIGWADEGLHVSFEPKFLTELRQAVAEGQFEELLARTSHMADQSANMDW